MDSKGNERGVEARKRGSSAKEILICVGIILAALAVACVAVFAIMATNSAGIVDGSSMYPTLKNGDRVINLSARIGFKRGDVVYIKHAETNDIICKRIIGLEGDVIEIDPETAQVFLNGEPLDEPYLGSATTDLEDMDGPYTVKPGHVFVMGDNRQHSTDSRTNEYRQIPVSEIAGKPVLVLCNTIDDAGIRAPWDWRIVR